MRGEAERMSRLIDELLILAGDGSLRRNFRPESVEPDTLLIDFVDTMEPQARKMASVWSFSSWRKLCQPYRRTATGCARSLPLSRTMPFAMPHGYCSDLGTADRR